MEAKTNGLDSMEANTNELDSIEAIPKLTAIGTDFEPNDNWLRFDSTASNLGWAGGHRLGATIHFFDWNHFTINYNSINTTKH